MATHRIWMQVLCWSLGVLPVIVALEPARAQQDPGDPVIDVWYGTNQSFGDLGIAQRWVNILGNVSDPDGIESLTFSLNGGPPRALSIGPDTRRLLAPGDFNVDIAVTDLQAGVNEVLISAVDQTSASFAR